MITSVGYAYNNNSNQFDFKGVFHNLNVLYILMIAHACTNRGSLGYVLPVRNGRISHFESNFVFVQFGEVLT